MDLGPLIPIAGILSGLGWGWLGYKKRELRVRLEHAKLQAAEERGGKLALEERVRVLEQIITDKGYQTAAEIEALRAPRLHRIEDVAPVEDRRLPR